MVFMHRLVATNGLANRPHVDHHHLAVNALNQIEVDAHMADDPHSSVRRTAQALGISRMSAHRMMSTDANGQKQYPYKFKKAMGLSERNIADRLVFANNFLAMGGMDGIEWAGYRDMLFTDEAHVDVDGYMNSQNMRIWAGENPLFTLTGTHHPDRLTIWTGISSRGLVGPFFILGIVDGATYRQLLVEKIIPELVRLGYDLDTLWWQQDGAPAHTAHATLELLQQWFGNRIISRGLEGRAWPGCSPDITPMDYFVWGVMKNAIFRPRDSHGTLRPWKPVNRFDLTVRIYDALSTITVAMCERAIRGVFHRCGELVINGGHHVNGLNVHA